MRQLYHMSLLQRNISNLLYQCMQRDRYGLIAVVVRGHYSTEVKHCMKNKWNASTPVISTLADHGNLDISLKVISVLFSVISQLFLKERNNRVSFKTCNHWWWDVIQMSFLCAVRNISILIYVLCANMWFLPDRGICLNYMPSHFKWLFVYGSFGSPNIIWISCDQNICI